MVIVLELIGMGMLFDVLNENTDIEPSPLLAAALFAVLMDFALAFFHHQFKAGLVTKWKVENVVVAGQSASTSAQVSVVNLDARISRRKRLALLFSVAIALFAMAKFYVYLGTVQQTTVFSGLGEDEHWIQIGSALAVYVIAAYIHIFHTGYFLSYLYAARLYRRDIASFNRGDRADCAAKDMVIELRPFANFASVPAVGEHLLVHETVPGKTDPVWLLKTNGLLLDDEVAQFVNKMNDADARREFALKAMEIQLRFVDAGKNP